MPILEEGIKEKWERFFSVYQEAQNKALAAQEIIRKVKKDEKLKEILEKNDLIKSNILNLLWENKKRTDLMEKSEIHNLVLLKTNFAYSKFNYTSYGQLIELSFQIVEPFWEVDKDRFFEALDNLNNDFFKLTNEEKNRVKNIFQQIQKSSWGWWIGAGMGKNRKQLTMEGNFYLHTGDNKIVPALTEEQIKNIIDGVERQSEQQTKKIDWIKVKTRVFRLTSAKRGEIYEDDEQSLRKEQELNVNLKEWPHTYLEVTSGEINRRPSGW